VRRDRHLFLEPVDNLDAVPEPVRLVELLRRRRILESPCPFRPHVNFVNRTDDPGREDFLDRPTGGRGVTLIAHLRRQLRVLGGGLADQSRFPDVVGEWLLAVDVLAVRQCEVGGERVRMLRCRDDHSIEVLGVVEHFSEVGLPPGLGESL
jgi:hypothetical protein